MKKCRHCKSEIKEEDVFCEKCGNLAEGNKETDEFIRMKSGYPVMGGGKEDNIVLKEERLKFKNRFSNMKNKIKEKVKNNSIYKKARSKIKKNKKDEDNFILDNFEGVYYSESKLSKKKILKYTGISIAAILGLFLLVFFGNYMYGILFPSEIGPCPFECCINSTYDDKFCPGYAVCEENTCILEECPIDNECCQGVMYKEKKCCDKNLICNDNFQCVKKECPFECCTKNDIYAEKECANEGNCINNVCHLKPCPYECCVDEIKYDDKKCDVNEVCEENKCISRFISDTKKMFKFFIDFFDLLI